jgi:hypothetical protein
MILAVIFATAVGHNQSSQTSASHRMITISTHRGDH